jgi:hypothetical protein
VDPTAGSICPVLLLPDWHNLLECVNKPSGRIEGILSVWAANRNPHARFSWLEVAESMDNSGFLDRPAAPRFRFQFS